MIWEAVKPLKVIRYGQAVRLKPGDAVHPDDEIALKYEQHRGAIRKVKQVAAPSPPPKPQPKPKVKSKPASSKPIPKKTQPKAVDVQLKIDSETKDTKEATEKVQEKKDEEPKDDDLDLHHADSSGP